MNRFTDHIYSFSLRFIQIVLLLFTGLLLTSGFLATCFATDMETQLVLTKWDNPLILLAGTAVFCFVLFGAATFFSWSGSAFISRNRSSVKVHNRPRSKRGMLRLFVLCWCIALGMVLILFSKTVPAADAYSVYAMAESLASGDTSVIHPTDSYISYYPQQAGLLAFWEPLIRFWNLLPIHQHAYHFIKILYVVLVCIIIVYQEKLVHTLWKDERADCLYLLLAGANCPLIMYSSFVYSEIPSFAALSIGLYLLTRLLQEKNRPLLAPGCILFLTLSVMLRKNSLIFIIAALLVLLVCALKQRRPLLVFTALICMVCSLSILPCVQKYYEYRSGSSIGSGVPAMSYFAMGMQESSRANGWYNGFNFNTYQASGMDTEATVAISQEAIRERLAYFKEHPGYAFQFYLQKFLSQWADGTYACRQATLATFGGRSSFFVSLYQGKASKYLIGYCNIYQNVMYLGAFWFCLTACAKKHREKTSGKSPLSQAPAPEPHDTPQSFRLFVYLGFIGVFGGFLFHMIWEANSRYIFLYSLAMLPYAAKGLSLLTDAAISRITRFSSKNAG